MKHLMKSLFFRRFGAGAIAVGLVRLLGVGRLLWVGVGVAVGYLLGRASLR